MTLALITLAFLLALQTARVWIWRRLAKRAMALNAELLEQNDELLKRVTIRAVEKEGEWPEFIEGKGI